MVKGVKSGKGGFADAKPFIRIPKDFSANEVRECRDLLGVRKTIMPIAEQNKKSMNAMDTYAEVARWVLHPASRYDIC
jgi:hypothetical protein